MVKSSVRAVTLSRVRSTAATPTLFSATALPATANAVKNDRTDTQDLKVIRDAPFRCLKKKISAALFVAIT